MNRIKELAAKLCSVKGVVFFTATGLLFAEKIDSWVWLGAAALFVGGRAYEKIKGMK
jgi:hypothetical protein